jgi:hypothetical protein
MHWYKIVPPILLILSLINVTLAAPVVSREICHACVDVMDVREDAIPVSRSGKQDDELEKLWNKPSPAMHPRTSPTPSEPDYETAPDSRNSFQTTSNEYQQESSEIKTLPGHSPEVSSIESDSRRISDAASSDYQASNEGGPGSSKSVSFSYVSPTQKSFLSKLVSKSKNFLSKSKDFFVKLAGKLKFWRRTSESVSDSA